VTVDIQSQIPPELAEEIARQQAQSNNIPLYIVIFGVVLLGFLGLLYLFAPEEVWHFQHRRTVRDGTPTRYALIANRAMGILFLLAAVALIVLAVIVNND
jgi:hypothetical protein